MPVLNLPSPQPGLPVLLAVAAAYALIGWAALQVSTPPDYVALVFPPAGIALSAMLIFGIGVWPAVFVGSLMVNVVASIQAGADPLSWVTLVPPTAATLQALSGTWLGHRLVGFPNALDTPRSITRFLLLVAPVSCLVAASIAVPALVRANVIAVDDGLFNWWNWWLGDTLGVLLAAPLMFVFFGQPRDLWRPRRLAVALPLAITTLLTALVFLEIRNSEDDRIGTEFLRDAENAATLVDKRLQTQLDMILAIERYAALNPELSRNEFREFVAPMLQRHPGTQNFSWNPYVAAVDREDFEQRVRRLDRPDFVILDRDESRPGRTAPAAPRDRYLPILYVEPLEDNLAVLGLNPLSIPAASLAIANTLGTGKAKASEGFTLTQERSAQRGVVVYQAVFSPADDLVDGSAQPIGVVSGAFRMDDVLAATLADIEGRGLRLCLVDLDADNENRRLSGPMACADEAWMETELAHAFPILFGDRNWEIRLSASDTYAAGLKTWAAWTTVAVGLFGTGILGAFLLMTTGQARRIADLVARRTAELAATTWSLQEEQAALSRAQRIARTGSWEIIPGQSRVICSEGLSALLGLQAGKQLSRQDLLDAVAADDRPRILSAIERLSEQPGAVSMDCRTTSIAGRVLHVLIESDWTDGRLSRIRGTAQDVTEVRKAESEIQQLAHYDALTGLPNRSLWMIRARAALLAAQRHHDALAVLFLDLDHFKTVNDSLGHTAGDKLLVAVARRLAGSVREEDVLARLGGDEFVALLPRLSQPEDAATVARKMLAALTRPIELDGHELNLSVSIGIAFHPADGNDVDTLLKHADIAMYGAKDSGRNNYHYFVPEMNARVLERLRLESGLRRAIERDELILHYQPQFDTTHGRITGVEALVRWKHPDMGLIMPDRFIPVAEDSGLIVPLGAWVLRHACRQQLLWRAQGHGDLLVAVNISALQFRRTDFIDRLQDTIAETGACADCLELEITESALMQPSEELFARLARLGELGLTLALDDFGTGYSSLAYLKRLPIKRLKLDRSFVRDLPGDAEDAAIATAAISMARDLGIQVIAEGVETPAQREFLSARGCRTMQGYLFARPMPAEDLDRILGTAIPDRIPFERRPQE